MYWHKWLSPQQRFWLFGAHVMPLFFVWNTRIGTEKWHLWQKLDTLLYDMKTQSQGTLYPTNGHYTEHKFCRNWAIYRTLCTQTQTVRVQVIKTVLFKIPTFHSINAASLGKQFPRFRRGTTSTCSGSVFVVILTLKTLNTKIFRKFCNYEYLPTDSLVFMNI